MMVYLMVKYQDPATYALLDLTTIELDAMASALNEAVDLWERLGATADNERMIALRTLTAAIERQYESDD